MRQPRPVESTAFLFTRKRPSERKTLLQRRHRRHPRTAFARSQHGIHQRARLGHPSNHAVLVDNRVKVEMHWGQALDVSGVRRPPKRRCFQGVFNRFEAVVPAPLGVRCRVRDQGGVKQTHRVGDGQCGRLVGGGQALFGVR